MAVVQISRIQNRRGRRDNLPQLASGEFGWAIDSQELFIGNGAVSEGAPAVGNTKLLTENDDLLGLAGQYAYKRDEIQTGVSIGSPVERTLQAKLDDIVSVRDFGALGDGTDQTEKIQRAVDQLFINSATKGLYKSRVTLHIPAGEYVLSSPIYVPPFANIIGDGKDKTFINASTAVNAFRTVNEDSIPGTPASDSLTDASNQARQITIKGMTIQHSTWTDATIRLESTIDSVFEDLKFVGSWVLVDGYLSGTPIAIEMNSGSTGLNCANNKFVNLEFSGYVYPVYSDYDSEYNEFTTGKINLCGYGFAFGTFEKLNPVGTIGSPGQLTGPNYNLIKAYVFDDVYRHGIQIENGSYNASNNNKFLAVGNDGGASSSNNWSVIKTAYDGNTSENDYFQRTQDLSVYTSAYFFAASYKPEIQGPITYTNKFPVTSVVRNHSVAEDFIMLPIDAHRGVVEIEYQYRAELAAGEVLRQGTWTITYNQDAGQHSFDDVYTYTGDTSKSTAMEFTGSIQSGNRYLVQVENSTLDAISPESDKFTFIVKHYTSRDLSIV